YSTYFGGAGDEKGGGIVVSPVGTVYVTGSTSSTDFPTTAGAYKTQLAGTTSAFVAKLDPNLSSLFYSTYLAGSANHSSGAAYNAGTAIGLDRDGNAYVTGSPNATNFPTRNPLQATFGGAFALESFGDAFVTKLNQDGTDLVYSTYLGGGASDVANGI